MCILVFCAAKPDAPTRALFMQYLFLIGAEKRPNGIYGVVIFVGKSNLGMLKFPRKKRNVYQLLPESGNRAETSRTPPPHPTPEKYVVVFVVFRIREIYPEMYIHDRECADFMCVCVCMRVEKEKEESESKRKKEETESKRKRKNERQRLSWKGFLKIVHQKVYRYCYLNFL